MQCRTTISLSPNVGPLYPRDRTACGMVRYIHTYTHTYMTSVPHDASLHTLQYLFKTWGHYRSNQAPSGCIRQWNHGSIGLDIIECPHPSTSTPPIRKAQVLCGISLLCH